MKTSSVARLRSAAASAAVPLSGALLAPSPAAGAPAALTVGWADDGLRDVDRIDPAVLPDLPPAVG
jgi:hypothetical protein